MSWTDTRTRREEVEAVRAEVGEDSLFKTPIRAPQMFQVFVCVKGLESAVGQSCSFLEWVAACTVEYLNTLDESGKRVLGKHVRTSGEGSLDPRFYINFYQSLAERLEGVDYH